MVGPEVIILPIEFESRAGLWVRARHARLGTLVLSDVTYRRGVGNQAAIAFIQWPMADQRLRRGIVQIGEAVIKSGYVRGVRRSHR